MPDSAIPVFKEINDHYEGAGLGVRTENPNFHVAKLEEMEGVVIHEMPPYRNSFYEIIYGKNVVDMDYSINGFKFKPHPFFILFSAPNQVHSWVKKGPWEGSTICFKVDFLKPYINSDILKEFPFFGINEANFLRLEKHEAAKLELYIDNMYEEQENEQIRGIQIIKSNLLSLLQTCERIYENDTYSRISPKIGYSLVAQYQTLIDENFTKFHMVRDYAELLNKTPNYLTQMVMKVTGRSAKSFIIDRLLLEARYQLAYTELDIAEISYMLNFNTPTHFGQFFKKHQGLAPSEFRGMNSN
ncbi:MAG: helix-turn-helix domain-containing protein [Bacteroidota bacterium]